MPRSSRLRKKSCDSTPGRSVKTPCCTPPVFAPSTRRPPTRTVISLAVSSSMYARSTSSVSGESLRPGSIQLRKPSARRLEPAGSSRRRSAPARRRCGPGVNGTVTGTPASAAAFSTAGAAAQHDQVGERDRLAGRRADSPSSSGDDLLRAGVDRPVRLRLQAQPGAVRAAALVGAAVGRGRRPGGVHELRDGQAGGEQPLLELGDLGLADAARGRPPGTGSCQSWSSCGTSGPR